MKYCKVCKKFASALGIEGVMFCVFAGHEFIDKTFDDVYKEALKNV